MPENARSEFYDPTGPAIAKRPTGSLLLWSSVALATLGGLVLLFAVLSATGGGSAGRLLVTSAAGILGLALLTALIGIVVRAIWFLPGDDSKKLP